MKIDISIHFKKQNIEKKCFLKCSYLGQINRNLKMANLAQIITFQICARNLKSLSL